MQGIVIAVYGESDASNLTIQCEFLVNSDAMGCMVVLLLDNVENITINISRTGDSAFHMLTPFCGNVTKVFAFDIEYDGTVGVNPISGMLARNTSAMLTCDNLKQPSDSVSSKYNSD